MIVHTWNYTPLPGVSLYDHCVSLPIYLIDVYAAGCKPGCLVVSPMIAPILDTQRCFKPVKSPAGLIRRIGDLFNIPVWVNVDIVGNEALAVSEPDDLYPTAKLMIVNLVEETALVYLAGI